jgi:hypothetical protein
MINEAAFAVKCMAVTVTCAGFAPESVKVRQCFSFPGTRENVLVGFVAVEWVFAHAIARVVKEKRIDRSRKEGNCWNGRCHYFCHPSSCQ